MKRSVVGLIALASLIGVLGCGASFSKVEGKVEYEDGSPISGATVVFVPDDPKGAQAEGFTDDSGKFTLTSGSKEGAQRGKYKVVISKRPNRGSGAMDAGGKDYLKAMKEGMGKGGAGGGPPGMPGMMQKGAGGSKSQLGEDYASADKTPFKDVAVPAASPLVFKIKGKKPAEKKSDS